MSPAAVPPDAAVLYLSLVYSLPLVALAHAAAWRRTGVVPWALYLVLGGAYAVAPVMCLAFSPPTAILFVTLAVALGAWAVRRHRGGRFWPYSAAAVATAYLAVYLLYDPPKRQEFARLRERHPFEPMAGRVPEPPRADHPPADPAGLAALDYRVQAEARGPRPYALERIHEETTWLFVNTPGFGVGRTVREPSLQQ